MKKNTKKPQKNLAQSFKSLSLGRKLLLAVFLAIIASSALPVLLVMLIGLLPTITILIIDPKNSSKLVIVGCFNISGLFIYLVNLFNQMDMNYAISILGNAFNMIIMLGSAAIGFILYYEMPNLFVIIAKNAAQRRLISIDKQLNKISEEWGNEIINEQINQKSR